jgi:hypothetical protein
MNWFQNKILENIGQEKDQEFARKVTAGRLIFVLFILLFSVIRKM